MSTKIKLRLPTITSIFDKRHIIYRKVYLTDDGDNDLDIVYGIDFSIILQSHTSLPKYVSLNDSIDITIVKCLNDFLYQYSGIDKKDIVNYQNDFILYKDSILADILRFFTDSLTLLDINAINVGIDILEVVSSLDIVSENIKNEIFEKLIKLEEIKKTLEITNEDEVKLQEEPGNIIEEYLTDTLASKSNIDEVSIVKNQNDLMEKVSKLSNFLLIKFVDFLDHFDSLNISFNEKRIEKIKNLNNLIKVIKKFHYGVVNKENEQFKDYKAMQSNSISVISSAIIQTPDQVQRNKLGFCVDVALMVYSRLKELKYKVKLIYLYVVRDGNIIKEHSYVILNDENEFYKIDLFFQGHNSSKEHLIYKTKFSNLPLLYNHEKNKFISSYKKNLPIQKKDLLQYADISSISEFIKGMNIEDFHKYILMKSKTIDIGNPIQLK
jgi:hypothetical protein